MFCKFKREAKALKGKVTPSCNFKVRRVAIIKRNDSSRFFVSSSCLTEKAKERTKKMSQLVKKQDSSSKGEHGLEAHR